MKNLLFALRTLSPLHCGTGQGVNDIDLPTARHAVSGHPIVPGSSLKGVLKDEFIHGRYKTDQPDEIESLFGGSGSNDPFASSISLGDALLLALPVRSFFGTFGYLASPYTLQMLKNQFDRMGIAEQCPEIPHLGLDDPENDNFKVITTSDSVLKMDGNQVLLEELNLLIANDKTPIAEQWADLIAPLFFNDEEGQAIFKKRFAIIDDNALDFLCETALPVDARISIDEKTGTVKAGALWYEETVSPETLFTGVVSVDRSFKPGIEAASEKLSDILTGVGRIQCQVGGKYTTGKGFVAIDFKDNFQQDLNTDREGK